MTDPQQSPAKATKQAGSAADDLPPVHFQTAYRSAAEAELDMTPMCDVTFLLLIFFMVTAAFAMQKSFEVPAPDEGWAVSSRFLFRYDGEVWRELVLPVTQGAEYMDVHARVGDAWVLADPDVPPCEGAYRPLAVHAPEARSSRPTASRRAGS